METCGLLLYLLHAQKHCTVERKNYIFLSFAAVGACMTEWAQIPFFFFLTLVKHEVRFLPRQRPMTTCEPSLRGSLHQRRKTRTSGMRSPCSTCPRTVPSSKPRWLTTCTRMTIRRNGEPLVGSSRDFTSVFGYV